MVKPAKRIGFYARIFVHTVMFTNQYIELEITTIVFDISLINSLLYPIVFTPVRFQ